MENTGTIHAVILAENVKFSYKELWLKSEIDTNKISHTWWAFTRVEECYVYFKERCLINSRAVFTFKCCIFLLILLADSSSVLTVSYSQTIVFLVPFMATFKITYWEEMYNVWTRNKLCFYIVNWPI